MSDGDTGGTRLGVVGAGAMGAIFGVALAESGRDTVLVDVSTALVDAARREGFTIENADGRRNVQVEVVTDPSGLQPVDMLLIFVKGHQTAAAIDLARPVIDPKTTVASLQNGWGNGEVIAEKVSPEQVVIGVTTHSGTVVAPARVAHTNSGATYVGPYETSAGMERAERLASVLNAASIETEATERVREEIWKKLVLNSAALPTAALTRLTAEELAEPGPVLDLVLAVADETVAVAQGLGHSIDPDERRTYISDLLLQAGRGRASMLQDLEAERRTEIETINGAVVRVAEVQGICAPLNECLMALVLGYERAKGLRA